MLSTPELSFVIDELKALGGINLSASHNPPDDNGLKVYDEFGSQPIAPNDQLLVEAMDGVRRVEPLPFKDALAKLSYVDFARAFVRCCGLCIIQQIRGCKERIHQLNSCAQSFRVIVVLVSGPLHLWTCTRARPHISF